ncbi:MAG: hypothetical protein HUU02_10500 [Bacteroidetes bacterium]|nr:hypothetical protein [Bacteroidota bacterium]
MSRTTLHIAERTLSLEETTGILYGEDGAPVPADVRRISAGEYSVIIQGRSYHIFLSLGAMQSTATVNNFIFPIERETLRDQLTQRLKKEARTENGSVTVRAPMPGLITKLLKQEGAVVQHGEGVLVIEAMKMENEIKAPKSGTIKRMFVAERRTAEKNDQLFTIE